MTREDASYVLLPYGALLLIAQHGLPHPSRGSAHTSSARVLAMMFREVPPRLGRGRHHGGAGLVPLPAGGKHIDCAQADCRAEEIRPIALRRRGDPSRRSSRRIRAARRATPEHLEPHLRDEWPRRPMGTKGRCGMCVPRATGEPICQNAPSSRRRAASSPRAAAQLRQAVPLVPSNTAEFTSAFDPLPDEDIANSEASDCHGYEHVSAQPHSIPAVEVVTCTFLNVCL